MSTNRKKFSSFSTNLTASGTPQRVTATDTFVTWCMIVGKYGNTGPLYLGTSEAGATAALGYHLTASQASKFEWQSHDRQEVLNLAELYFDGTTTNDDILVFYTAQAAESIA